MITNAKQSDFTLLKGDALDAMQKLPAESVHAVICDPPYGLTNKLDLPELLATWQAGDTFVGDDDGYAGAEWDNSVPGPELWREVYRVLKPGGFLAAFAAARTVHLTALAIQLADFEVRDVISWVYAPGRPATGDLGRKARSEGDDALGERLDGLRSTLRPGYEPIVIARKPFDDGDTTTDNLVDFGVGVINHRALTNKVGGIATNVWVVHEIGCTEQQCFCDLSHHGASTHGTHLYPRAHLGDGALNVAKPGLKERPLGVDGKGHETVKPLELMQRLIEAFSFPGQTVLDPFLGSGTTAEAALQCGRLVVGCEREPRYWPLIEERVRRVTPKEMAESPVGMGSSDLQTTSVRRAKTSAQSKSVRANPGETTKQLTNKKEKSL